MQAIDLRFNVLGPLEVFNGERVCTPTAPKVRGVLALLLLRANRLVETRSLIEELWGECPPQSAVTTAQTYIYHLRKLFARVAGPDAEQIFLTRAPGYLIDIAEGQLDLQVFDRLTQQGRTLLGGIATGGERREHGCCWARVLLDAAPVTPPLSVAARACR